MYLFDENISHNIVNMIKQLGVEASHIQTEFGASILDVDFLPQIGNSSTILVTADLKMKSFYGKDGHGAILREFKVKALFLPSSFLTKPLGIPESKYPSVAWAQCAWILRYWHEIEAQITPIMSSLALARVTDRGKVERI